MVNPRIQIKRKKPYSVSSFFNINKGDRTSNWVGNSDLKELDINDFFERKQMIEDMEAEMTEAQKTVQIMTIWWWLKRQMLKNLSLQKPRLVTTRKSILNKNERHKHIEDMEAE